MNKEIPLSVPNLNTEIVENLRECIETGWVSTGGRFIGEFEKKVAKYVGTDNAVSVQSGTAGLHVALRILGVCAGDEVFVPTLTFIAAVNPVKYLGAKPVFMDCDDRLCVDPDKLERFCAEECELSETGLVNKATGKKIGVLIVVHVFGNLADMERIMDIAGRYKIKVLEDATEALGSYFTQGRYKGRHAGTLGDMGVYSFNANKIITTGGGGMIVSHNQAYLEEARYLTTTAKNDPLYFAHDEVGYNYRMLNIQAALGVSQIDRLEAFIEIKQQNYALYKSLLKGREGIGILPFAPGIRANHWFYSLQIDDKRFGESRDQLMRRMIATGVQCRPVWKLTHTQKPYGTAQRYQIERAAAYAETVLNLPCSTNLTAEEVEIVCRAILT